MINRTCNRRQGSRQYARIWHRMHLPDLITIRVPSSPVIIFPNQPRTFPPETQSTTMVPKLARNSAADSEKIFSLYWQCIESLHQLFDNIKKSPENDVPDSLRAAVGWFRVWAKNVAAHRRGSNSPDYKLREATRFRGHVANFATRFG